MFPRALFVAAVGFFVGTIFAGCSGGGVTAPGSTTLAAPGNNVPAQNPQASTQSVDVQAQSVDVQVGTAPATATLPLTSGFSGAITLHAKTANTTLKISTQQSTAVIGRVTPLWHGTCPQKIPPIVLYNPFPFPVTISIDSFTVKVPCSVNGLLFGASAYQSSPVPQTLVSTKLGDASGSGHTLTFTPTASQLTFPANSALTISILPETSTAFTQLPAIPNTTTVLTSNAPAVPNSLALAFPNVQGGTTYQSACYLPNDPNGPGLGGIHILGIPSFYCVLVPGQAGTSTSFGGASSSDVVTFTLGPNAKPDRSYVGLDGPPLFAPCAPESGGQVCNSPPFAIPLYSKAIVGNVKDIQACAPVTENTDCNGVDGNPKAPSATSVKKHKSFQLLFADDPTYNAANTFGGVTLQVNGSWAPCTIDIGDDDKNDVPPGYSDPGPPPGATPYLANYTGVGPYVEFDIKARDAGTCTVNLTEDTGLKRTFVFTITVAKW